MKEIVISGINLFEGGPLSIYYDCLDEILKGGLYKKNRITIFVHRKELFSKYLDFVDVIELPKSRKNYLFRLYYEYIYFYFYSKKRKIDIWLSLHDITPNVISTELYTYCHNPSPFMKTDLRKIKYSARNVAFSIFYKYLYRINIHKNTAVIVQQDWMRKEFISLYNVKNVIVARPNKRNVFHSDGSASKKTDNEVKQNQKKIFIYPAFPRMFKNFEVICEASSRLVKRNIDNYEVWLTIDGSENRYSSDIYQKYKNDPHIKWLGIQNRDKLFELYNQSDCMIFPSHLETWGLPISEYKQSRKDMIIVNLPYAYETLGTYDMCMFFDENDVVGLARLMSSVIRNEQKYTAQVEKIPSEPYARDWNELLLMLTNDI